MSGRGEITERWEGLEESSGGVNGGLPGPSKVFRTSRGEGRAWPEELVFRL